MSDLVGLEEDLGVCVCISNKLPVMLRLSAGRLIASWRVAERRFSSRQQDLGASSRTTVPCGFLFQLRPPLLSHPRVWDAQVSLLPDSRAAGVLPFSPWSCLSSPLAFPHTSCAWPPRTSTGSPVPCLCGLSSNASPQRGCSLQQLSVPPQSAPFPLLPCPKLLHSIYHYQIEYFIHVRFTVNCVSLTRMESP